MAIYAKISMENGQEMLFVLDKAQAPNTVNNFVDLANKGFYDGLIFHRVIENFMIQGGCPEGTGMGGPGYRIKGEFQRNGFKNERKHERGVLSMARSALPNSAGSQFFVMHKNAPHLDGDYAAFGYMVEGEDVLDSIATTQTTRGDRPVVPQKIASIRCHADAGEVFEAPERYV